MKFSTLSKEQIDLIINPEYTLVELADIIGCGVATIQRWRKKLGVVVGRGSKKGKPRPWQSKTDTRICECCSSQFTTKPSSEQRYCSLKCSTKSIDRSYMSYPQYRNTLIKEDTPEFQKYRNRVQVLTRKTYEEYKDYINPNNFKRAVAGVDEAYQLDHIVSVRYGFDNGFTPEEISNKDNLQMLPWKENIVKGCKI